MPLGQISTFSLRLRIAWRVARVHACMHACAVLPARLEKVVLFKKQPRLCMLESIAL